jgi:excisionase family DNA binding protein
MCPTLSYLWCMQTTSLNLIRISVVAGQLGVHPKTVRRWLASGRLHSVRLPSGERRVPREALTAILTGEHPHEAEEGARIGEC